MNQTLGEMSHAMLSGQESLEFLWEPALEHTAYVRNQAYTQALEGKTPYKASFEKKPTITGLQEFGAPVWVLLQGQKAT